MTDRAPELAAGNPAPWIQWRRLDKLDTDHELIWLLTSSGSAAFGYGWLLSGRSFPACTLKLLTGCPCPTCGATRATLKILAGDFAGALALNPLFVAGLVFLLVYNLYAATVLLGRLPRLRVARLPHGWGRRIRWAVVAVILLNWSWLFLRGV